ncbi:hypothetical protein Back11_38470 [Paenibacillus baekrokdamisoli]|uniref:Uncharacterized protein n=1 Tax=Paenibacillus baekrokdamisoli TaxID=1712516 RepID=A0A3G9IW32_9BACL|nr:hypothetical protein [Paenibacillus baekrokdamisoli]MBB3068456.1 hypothetical protein [Paenibacillus baekrokdamisoli]BBH22502.1 hypothetical protein Back11_38470 [Paenibacillus baekrokdamisoli]
MNEMKSKDWTKTWTTAAAAIHGALDYTDKKYYSLVDVMGITGHAFRMNIDPEHIDVAGPTMFPGGYLIRRNLCNLGFISNLSDTQKPFTPEKVEKVMALIQQSVDKGIPAISFDLFIPEFGLIYGYDDEKQVFHAKDVSKEGTISYTDFVENRNMLWVTTINESLPHSKYEILRMALDMIVDHTRGREWQHIFQGKYMIGLAGYDAWIACLERRAVDPFGNAYNIAVVSDAREYAEQFLREIVIRWSGDNVVERTVRSLAAEAAAHYEKTAAALIEMRDMFPFPQGGQPDDPVTAVRAVELLRAAKETEEQGIEVLERLLNFMKAYWSEQWIN